MKTIGIIIALILGYETNDNLRREREKRKEYYEMVNNTMSVYTGCSSDSIEYVTDSINNLKDTIK